MAVNQEVKSAVEMIAKATTWNKRVALIRAIPEHFGIAHHRTVYAKVAEAIYVNDLAPDFAYVHWRDGYELAEVEQAYVKAFDLTGGFADVTAATIAGVIESEPTTLRVFRLLIGLTTQEFAATASIIPGGTDASLSNGAVKGMEAGAAGNKASRSKAAVVAAKIIDGAMRGELFPPLVGEIRSKLTKPDTIAGWETVRKYATENVPLPVFLHQRHYGGAFRQLLDATSGKRGDVLEDAVAELFTVNAITFVQTGSSNHGEVGDRFGLTVKPSPDFIIHDAAGALRAILECKQANDGGTARDKAARFSALRNEAMRLGGIPVFAVLAGLGWRRSADTLGPVVRDTDGRVFTVKTLRAITSVEPFPSLLRST